MSKRPWYVDEETSIPPLTESDVKNMHEANEALRNLAAALDALSPEPVDGKVNGPEKPEGDGQQLH